MTSQESRPLRRMRTITSVVMVATVAGVGLTSFAIGLDEWWQALAVLPSFAVAVWVTLQWHTPPRRPVLAAALAVTGATWTGAVLAQLDPSAVLPFAAVAAVAVTSLSARRTQASLVLLAVAVGIAALVGLQDPDRVVHYATVAAFFSIIFITTFWLNDIAWRLFTELETMRRTEAELAVVKERMRFASDLHDIQGHTLHVIKLKAAVAARLQHTDPERVAAELADIERLTAQTIEQAQHLVNSTRRLSFSAELANAEALLSAAGIEVSIMGDPSQPADDELFALVLREATTNMLRHPSATRASIDVARSGMTIVNDGAEAPARPLRGLAALSERVARAGGALSVDHAAAEFALHLTAPREVS